MASRKVYIDVIVDDKGTTKRLAVDSAKLEKALAATEKTTGRATKAQRGLAQTAASGSKNFANMSAGITGGLVPAYATLAAQIFAVTAAFNFLKDAGSLRQLQQGQVAYAAAVGTSLSTLTKDLQRATDAQLGFRDAAQAAAIGVAAGLDPDQITKIGTAARDASQVLGRDLTDSFNRLVRGITKAEPELLDELGIILRLETATRNYKDALGITGELTAFQRSQAVANEVLGQAEEKYGKVIAAVGGTENSFAQLATAFEDITNSIRNFAVDFLTPIATTLRDMPVLIALAFAPFTAQVIGAALPGLSKLNEGLQGVAKKAKESADASTKVTKSVMRDQERLTQNPGLRKSLERKVRDESTANLKSVKANKRSLLQKLKDGKQLTNAQIAQVRKNLAKEARGYKIKDKQIKGSLHKTLNEMERLNNAKAKSISGTMRVMASQVKLSIQSIVPTAKTAFASITGFAVRAGGMITTALSALSWISLIATLGVLVVSFFKNKSAIDKTADSYDYLGEKIKTITKETDDFIKVQNILNDTYDDGNKIIEAFGKKLANVSTAKLGEKISADRLAEITKDMADSIKSAEDRLPKLEQVAEKTGKALDKANRRGSGGVLGISVEKTARAVQAQAELNRTIQAAESDLRAYIEAKGDDLDQTEKGLKLLLDDKKAIEGIKNERFRTNAVVTTYLDLLEKLNKGQIKDINQVTQQRVKVQELSAAVTELTRLQTDNSRKIANMEQATLPLSQHDQLIESLTMEMMLLKEIAATNEKGLNETETKRLAFLRERLELTRSLANLEFTVNAANQAINKTQIQLSRGKTKLLRDDVALSAKIAQNQVKIFQSEQKIGQAQDLARKQRADLLVLAQSDSEFDRQKAVILQDSLNTRERSIITEQNNLDILRLQSEELERQKNEYYQIADAASQAFENSLQKNIADVIKGKENSISDAVANIARATLESVADSLSTIFTRKIMKSITGEEDPDVKMARAIANSTNQGATVMKQSIVGGATEGAAIIAERIKAALASQPMVTPSGSVTSPTGPTGSSTGTTEPQVIKSARLMKNQDAAENPLGRLTMGPSLAEQQKKGKELSYLEKIFGTGRGDIVTQGSEDGMETVGINKAAGSFNNFLGSLGDIFNKNAEGGFIEKLGIAFEAGGGLLGDVFGGLPDLFGNLFGDLFGSLGGLFGGGAGGGGLLSGLASMIPGIGPVLGGAMSLFGFKNGGIMNNGSKVSGYATGGIAEGPKQGHLAMLHGREAVVPLPNGNKIPVDMKGMGAGMQNNNVTVNVSTDGQVQSSANGPMGENLGQVIAAAVQKELHNQKRAGGILNKHGAA